MYIYSTIDLCTCTCKGSSNPSGTILVFSRVSRTLLLCVSWVSLGGSLSSLPQSSLLDSTSSRQSHLCPASLYSGRRQGSHCDRPSFGAVSASRSTCVVFWCPCRYSEARSPKAWEEQLCLLWSHCSLGASADRVALRGPEHASGPLQPFRLLGHIFLIPVRLGYLCFMKSPGRVSSSCPDASPPRAVVARAMRANGDGRALPLPRSWMRSPLGCAGFPRGDSVFTLLFAPAPVLGPRVRCVSYFTRWGLRTF